jgi:hypothetical protein
VIATLALVWALQGQAGPTYADSATAALIARAQARHRQQDAAVHDYQAILRTRLDAEFGRGAFARFVPLAVEERESRLSWQAPNDVKVVTLGRRYRTAFRNGDVNSSWTRPWFVPRFLGDSIRLLSSDGFPSRAAVHPLSAGAAAYYRYAIDDSMQLVLPGRTVRAVGVRVTPIRADASLIAGELWVDAATAETVRLTMVFVGRRLWDDDSIGPTRRDTARAERRDELANRILRVSADLEYGLYDRRFWLPFRQEVTLDVRLPWFENLMIPIHFITTFRDVQVNTGVPIAFAAPPTDAAAAGGGGDGGGSDSTRRWCDDTTAVQVVAGKPREREQRDRHCVSSGAWPGGRFEMDTPPDAQLLHYAGWGDSLHFALSAADRGRLQDLQAQVRRLTERLPDSLTGRRRFGVAFDRLSDIWRYNRAEGPSVGWGYAWKPGPPSWSVLAKARYAFTDRRLQASLTLRHDGPRSRLDIEAYREMRDADPLAPGLTVTNSIAAALFARDDGAYYFAQGGELRFQRPIGRVADLTLRARYGEEGAPLRLAHSGLNDWLGGTGDFQQNTPVAPGHYGVGAIELAGGGRALGWRAGLEGTGGTRSRARAWLGAKARAPLLGGMDLTAAGWLGVGVGDSLPQRDFRLGGERTLRGYPAGALRGVSAWAAGIDVALARRAVTPIVFADGGQAAAHGLRFAGEPAFSFGAAVSVLSGALRLEAARPVAPHARWRVSLVVGARR